MAFGKSNAGVIELCGEPQRSKYTMEIMITVPACVFFFALCAMPLYSASSAVVTAGYKVPTPVTVAPGQVITFFVDGIGASLNASVRAESTPLPTQLAGITATLIQFNPPVPVPIFAIEPISPCADSTQIGCSPYTAVTVQLPFEMQAEDPTMPRGVPVGSAQLVFAENGAIAAKIDLISLVDEIHLVRTCDVLYTNRELTCRPVVTHPDGTLVSGENPAHQGEEVVLYTFGLGAAAGAATGQAPTKPLPTARSFTVSFDARQNALASRPQIESNLAGNDGTPTAIFVGLTPGYVGLYQVNVIVPSLPLEALPCYPVSILNGVQIESNLTINIGGSASFDGVGVCVQP